MFKKIMASMLALTLAFGSGVLPAVNVLPDTAVRVSAEDNGDYQYTVLDDGTVEISKYTGKDTEIKIPGEIDGKKVTSIGYEAFYWCTSLTNIDIPDSVASIGNLAFNGCKRLTGITIPDSVASIGSQAFCNCRSLTNIDVEPENSNYSSIEGVLYNKDKTELVCCPIGKTSVAIPDGVTGICESAFWDCINLTSITIPDSVTSIGSQAFWNCSSLTSINIPNGVSEINSQIFGSCEGLKNIRAPLKTS